jgi:hypothetical protein
MSNQEHQWEEAALRAELADLRRERGKLGGRVLEANKGSVAAAFLGANDVARLGKIEERVHGIFYRLNQLRGGDQA